MIKSVILTTTHDSSFRSDSVTWPSIAESTKTQIKVAAAVRADIENSLKRKSIIIVHGLKSLEN